MKKNFIYALIACFTLSLAACSTDPEDATSKHVYGENENPYLKTNADAVVFYQSRVSHQPFGSEDG